MKKLLSIAVCASAVAAFATEVVEVGTVGVTKITSSLTNTVVAVSYGDLASNGAITISNIVKTTGLNAGDRLHVFTGSNNYQTYILTAAPGNTHLYWEKTTTWGINASGEFYDNGGTPASESTLAAGVGFWLVRDTTKWGGGSFDFYTYGRPVPASTTATGGSTKLIGNPLDSAASPTITSGTVADGDRVIVPNDALPGGLDTYTYKTGKGWWHWVGNTRTPVDNLPAIPAGTGCWYATGSSNVTIGWTPAN